MIKVVSFLSRTLTPSERHTLESILKDEVSVTQCKLPPTNTYNKRSNDVVKNIPYDCDVVILKTHTYIAKEVSELTNLLIIQYHSVSDEQFCKVFKPWRIFRNGGLISSF